MKTITLAAVAAALLVQPIAAEAQFGPLTRHVPGLGVGTASGPSPDAFLATSMMSTKNVMIAAALLAMAVQDHTRLAGVKAYADQVQNCSDPKALDSMKGSLQSNIDALNGRKDLAGDITAAYNAGDGQEKKLIAVAVANMALGIWRDTQLASQAPRVISGVGSNPLMVGRLGQLKVAAGLLVLQSKGLISVGTALPKVMSAVKIAPPAMAETTKPQDFQFSS